MFVLFAGARCCGERSLAHAVEAFRFLFDIVGGEVLLFHALVAHNKLCLHTLQLGLLFECTCVVDDGS